VWTFFKKGNEEILVRTGDSRYLKTMKGSLHKKAWNPDIDGIGIFGWKLDGGMEIGSD